MRFGAEYVEAALTAQERKLMVMESSEVKDDLVQDVGKKHCMPSRNKTLLA